MQAAPRGHPRVTGWLVRGAGTALGRCLNSMPAGGQLAEPPRETMNTDTQGTFPTAPRNRDAHHGDGGIQRSQSVAPLAYPTSRELAPQSGWAPGPHIHHPPKLNGHRVIKEDSIKAGESMADKPGLRP